MKSIKTLSEHFNLPPNSFVDFLNAQRIIEEEEERQMKKRIKEYFDKKTEESK